MRLHGLEAFARLMFGDNPSRRFSGTLPVTMEREKQEQR